MTESYQGSISTDKTRVLFVCLGNICRSPSAESVFRHYVKQAGLASHFEIDSAGTSAHHAGEPADARMRAHAARRGYELTSLSRPLVYDDFFDFDHIVVMDDSNLRDVIARVPSYDLEAKVSKLTDWLSSAPIDHIPDPYYGGAEGFERVLDLVELCCPALLSALHSSRFV